MGDKREELKKALETQFKDVSEGTDGQIKKTSVETLQIMYNLALAQDKADQDSEFRESEMNLKEREMALREAEQKAKEDREKEEILMKKNELVIKERDIELREFQADEEAERKKQELYLKELELAVRKSELMMKKIEVAAAIALPIGGHIAYQRNFDKVYKFETETIQTVVAPKAAQYMKLMERTLTNGVRSIFRR